MFDNVGNAHGDHINDFARGDILDFKSIDANVSRRGDQAFTLIGASEFSGKAGQLRAYTDAGSTYLSGDTNGDGIADFTISFTGMHQFGGSDFIL